MKPTHPRSWALLRRLGLHLLSVGASTSDVMEELGVCRITVRKWALAVRDGADQRQPPRPAPALPAQTRARLPGVIAAGPAVYGFADGRWTLTRLAIMLDVEFGLSYTPLEVFRLLGDLIPQPRRAQTPDTPEEGGGGGNGPWCEPPLQITLPVSGGEAA